jgi:hypothetical protein
MKRNISKSVLVIIFFSPIFIFMQMNDNLAYAKGITYIHTCSKCKKELTNKKQTMKPGKCPKGGSHSWSHKQVIAKK